MAKKTKKAKKSKSKAPKAQKLGLGLKQLLREVDRRLKAAEIVANKATDPDVKKKAQKAMRAMTRVRSMTTSDACPFQVMGD
jgi:hypothetical protein